MIQHIVMYWMNDASDEEAVQGMVERFLSMEGKIPGLLSVKAGRDVLGSERSCDVCLCTTFDSLQALDSYREHPVHLPVKAYVHTVTKRSASADFEVT